MTPTRLWKQRVVQFAAEPKTLCQDKREFALDQADAKAPHAPDARDGGRNRQGIEPAGLIEGGPDRKEQIRARRIPDAFFRACLHLEPVSTGRRFV